MRGIVEEMAEDRGRAGNRETTERREPSDDSGNGGLRTLLFGGVAAVVLLAVVFLLLGGGDSEKADALLSIQERLNRLEERLDRLEESGPQLDSITERISVLQKTVNSLERDRPSMQQRIDRIARRVESLGTVPASPQKPVTRSSGGTRKHTIQKGETLFSIARRYSLSLDDLCRLNGIDRDDVIQPGQTLIIQGGG